jgi:hypothetical protein
MSDATNISMGPCSIVFNSVDLGHTTGGVTVSYEPTWTEIKVDKFGEAAVDKYLGGEKLTAKVKLSEFTMANLKVAMPAGTQTVKKITLGAGVGARLSDSAALLVLHPIANLAADRSEDVVMYQAAVDSAVELPHTNEGEKSYEVTFTALIDESKSNGDYLGMIGDSI